MVMDRQKLSILIFMNTVTKPCVLSDAFFKGLKEGSSRINLVWNYGNIQSIKYCSADGGSLFLD